MSDVKLFLTERDPEESALVSKVSQSGVDYSVVPTSGPVSIWVEGSAYVGSTAVRAAVSRLLEAVGTPQTCTERQHR
jgi:hypothetical protein